MRECGRVSAGEGGLPAGWPVGGALTVAAIAIVSTEYFFYYILVIVYTHARHKLLHLQLEYAKSTIILSIYIFHLPPTHGDPPLATPNSTASPSRQPSAGSPPYIE